MKHIFTSERTASIKINCRIFITLFFKDTSVDNVQQHKPNLITLL
jgi:hypothetical protein